MKFIKTVRIIMDNHYNVRECADTTLRYRDSLPSNEKHGESIIEIWHGGLETEMGERAQHPAEAMDECR